MEMELLFYTHFFKKDSAFFFWFKHFLTLYSKVHSSRFFGGGQKSKVHILKFSDGNETNLVIVLCPTFYVQYLFQVSVLCMGFWHMYTYMCICIYVCIVFYLDCIIWSTMWFLDLFSVVVDFIYIYIGCWLLFVESFILDVCIGAEHVSRYFVLIETNFG